MRTRSAVLASLLATALGLAGMQPALAQEGAATASTAAAPPLRIVLPKNGAVVGTTLALVIETPGDMSKLTMSAPVVGVHLHLSVDDTVLMPMQQQLIRLGGNRYLYLFDLPVKPGRHTLGAFWADASHDTIAKSVQRIGVQVTPDASP